VFAGACHAFGSCPGAAIPIDTANITEAVQMSDRILVMTYRPGRTKPIVDIDLPRSRSSEIVGSEAFGLHVAAIWSDFEGRGEPRHEGRQGCARGRT
jgi:NitT/TauT family transport system ATP-binding protein